ncbi:MAG TPA: cupin [Planctomycetaceae bacterium]|nr:cupin [Planctomycetaceae bacterium]|tara:strand:+ start:142 stop:510 length:369 start_codon:yes stop_codon:yes gene_type:complete
MDEIPPVNVSQKLSLFSDHWSPRVIAELNDYQIKVAKLCGEFVWHSHADTDEMFYCVSGSVRIELREGSVTLTSGEMYVVPKGVEHRPVADEECHVLLIEPRGVINTGDTPSDRTAPNDRWV